MSTPLGTSPPPQMRRRRMLEVAASALLARHAAAGAASHGLHAMALDDFGVVRMSRQNFLVGELKVRNATPEPLVLRRLLACGAGRRPSACTVVDGATLAASATGSDGRQLRTLALASGEHCHLHLWQRLASTSSQIRWLRLEASGASAETLTTGIYIQPPERAILLGPPLRGGPWVAVFDPWFAFGHRRAAFEQQGQRFIPARFAIDWIRLDPRGSPWPADRSGFEHWHGLSQDVLAVADGQIVAQRDGREDLLTGPRPKERWEDEDVAGNYLCLRVADDRYVFYEHLRKDSLAVKVGDHVRKGDVIARVGRSGINSSGPHLHFHVADRPALIFAQGRPFVIDCHQRLGTYADMQTAESGRAWACVEPPCGHRVEGELPAPNSVVRFHDNFRSARSV